MKSLPKIYQPQDYELSIYQKWEASGFFNPDKLPGKRKKTFSIVLPPPNVTGQLHLGHASMLSYQDIMIRYHRLKGDKTLWLPGMDHAAIATQNVVEKELKKSGLSRQALGRENFLERVNGFVASSRITIRNQLKKMGSSLDWSRERFTLDESSSVAVQTAFVKMHDDGLIYRGYRIVNWCPRCKSTLADDEVEYRETKAPFYYFKYGPVIIGTARPETKFSDKIIIVHPKDKRYRDLVNQEFEVEWINGKIRAKVMADEAADMAMGTGAMTITPAHSFADFDLAKKYNLEIKEIINADGRLTAVAGEFAGQKAAVVRKAIVDKLAQKGLVDHIDEDYVHNLSVCYRCGTPIEPRPSKQWFVDVNKKIPGRGKSLKRLAIEAVKKNKIKIIPDRFNKIYFQWLDNLRDWCVSRQIWYGHRIPVWYQKTNKKMGFYEKVIPQVYQGKTKTYRLRDHDFKVDDKVAFENSQSGEIFGEGEIIDVKTMTVGQIDLQDKAHGATYQTVEELIQAFKKHHPDKEVARQTPVWIYEYKFKENKEKIYVGIEQPQGEGWVQDEDTLDTWFSSGLWTFLTLGWPDKTRDIKDFHPTSVLETMYDILFFWVARMIIMSTYFMKEIPFKTVYLHAMVKDKQGRKMSKSLGNGIDPLEMIERFGADALRLSMIIGATPGTDMRLYEEKIAGYRNFVNKLWNISRYILTSVKEIKRVVEAPQPATLADGWILSELAKIIKSTGENIEGFKFSLAGEELYEFSWNKLADWYLEIAKLEGGKDEILLYILENLLKLWHPFCPFITEVLWESFESGELLMVQEWPELKIKNSKPVPSRAEGFEIRNFDLLRELITAVRNIRAENKIDARQIIDLTVKAKEQKLIEANKVLIEGLARVKLVEQTSGRPASLPWAELILDIKANPELEKKRAVEIKNLRRYLEIQTKKLSDASFIKKAPAEIVEQEREKLKEAQARLDK